MLRQLRNLVPHGPLVQWDGRELVNFASNDYLDLARHPELAKAQASAAAQWGAGSTGSRLLSGSLGIFAEAEHKLAAWKSTHSALFFNSGYTANLSLVSALCDAETHLFFDRLDHASLYDGARLSGAQLHRFRHNDANDLRTQLAKHRGKAWIFTESVFSMDGDLAPLVAYADLAEEFQAGLVVDEAHADGIFGPGGTGLVHELGLQNRVDVVMGTLGKALGCAGACVWASPTILQWLVNQARPFIYSTAQAPAVAGSVIRAIDLLGEEPWRRERLLSLSQHLRDSLVQHGFDILASQSQIVPVVIGESLATLQASTFLAEQGFWVAPIRPPTVPPGSSRLRINVNAGHTPAQIDGLVEALCRWRSRTGFLSSTSDTRRCAPPQRDAESASPDFGILDS